ncbi:MAG: hypothetical protein HYZ15_07050 [Sphingobacteriales bacterium]|nr:hypothetical protein [Sphingobacteriales bacterium]
MKKLVLFAFAMTALLFARPLAAQEKAKWNEKDAFHEVMSKTFHPAEEGKLEPIKTRSGEMLEKAIAWKNSTAPAGYDQRLVKKDLATLVKGAKKLNKLIKNKAADDAIKTQLTELHKVFHTITEKCEDEK